MEVVRQFSDEMNNILEGKLPVSRAKMASITKLALKAMKYYKHIVMTVEKFVARCASEYKLPGLYVIDSIVRQSRHQFGPDKDNFGPRFSKSFEKTFLHLFTCPSEDKAKVIRVLNLWQKNGVFPPEVIQPLLALAPSPQHTPGDSHLSVEAPPTSQSQSAPVETKPSGGGQTTLDLDSANQIIQRQQSQIQALLQQQQQLQTQASTLLGPALQGLLTQASDNPDLAALLRQSQELAAVKELVASQESQRTNGDPPPPAQMSNDRSVHSDRPDTEFNTALLDDFDYSDDEDIAPTSRKTVPETTTIDSEPKDSTDHLLEELQEQFRRQEAARAELPPPPQPPQQVPPPLPQHYPPPRAGPHPPPHPFPPPDMPLPPRMSAPHPPLPSVDYNHRGPPLPSQPPHFPPRHSPPSPYGRRGYRSPPGPPPMRGRRRSPSPVRRGSWRDRERDWDRDRDRDRDRRSPWRRSRSPPFRERNRSRTPPFRSPRRRSDDNERPRKGSVSNKEKHVTVLSTTIWMGHLAKSVSKEQIKEACSEHGQVQSVDVVSARGCAYVVMETRPNAVKVLSALRDLKINGSVCKLAWAPGRGVKGGAYRSFWNLDDGVSIIPWEAIESQSELEKFVDGGVVEPSTCPPGMNPPVPVKSDPPPQEQAPPSFPPPTMPPGQPHFPPQGMPPQPPQGMPPQPPPQSMPPQPSQGMPPQPPQGMPPQGMPPRPPQGMPPQGMPPRPPQGMPPQGMPPRPPQGMPPQGMPPRPPQGMPPRPPQGMPPQPPMGMPPRGMPFQPPHSMPPQPPPVGPPVPVGAPQSMFPPPPVSGGPPFPPALPNNAHLPHLPPDSSDSAVDMQIASSPPLNSEV